MEIERVTIGHASGALAEVLIGRGFNLYRWLVRSNGPPRDLLWSLPGFRDGDGRPSSSGIPILFPFAGRIRGTSFRFEDRAYSLDGDQRLALDPFGNALHGFVMNRPWRVVDQGKDFVRGEFHAARDAPDVLDRWPADFRITVRFEIQATGLIARIRVENPDTKPLPWGLGLHPYFRLPLGDEGRAEDCVLTVPADKQWQMTEMLPTGGMEDLPSVLPLRSGLPFRDARLDHVLTGLRAEGDVVCRVDDPANGRRLEVRFGTGFPHCVVYTPPHREAICIEPYTCVPNAFELAERGIETGLRILGPGMCQELETSIQLL